MKFGDHVVHNLFTLGFQVGERRGRRGREHSALNLRGPTPRNTASNAAGKINVRKAEIGRRSLA
jgi:hypothetical protein